MVKGKAREFILAVWLQIRVRYPATKSKTTVQSLADWPTVTQQTFSEVRLFLHNNPSIQPGDSARMPYVPELSASLYHSELTQTLKMYCSLWDSLLNLEHCLFPTSLLHLYVSTPSRNLELVQGTPGTTEARKGG